MALRGVCTIIMIWTIIVMANGNNNDKLMVIIMISVDDFCSWIMHNESMHSEHLMLWLWKVQRKHYKFPAEGCFPELFSNT